MIKILFIYQYKLNMKTFISMKMVNVNFIVSFAFLIFLAYYNYKDS